MKERLLTGLFALHTTNLYKIYSILLQLPPVVLVDSLTGDIVLHDDMSYDHSKEIDNIIVTIISIFFLVNRVLLG